MPKYRILIVDDVAVSVTIGTSGVVFAAARTTRVRRDATAFRIGLAAQVVGIDLLARFFQGTHVVDGVTT